jgi:hypothetical protein
VSFRSPTGVPDMSAPDYFHRFSINVARFKDAADWDGVRRAVHYCRIAIPETFREEAEAKARAIAATFGPEFEVTLTGHTEYGTGLSF